MVRSHRHAEILAAKGFHVEVIPDGVDTQQFRPLPDGDLRRQYNLEGFTVIGLLGSLIWNARSEMCYGSELIEVIEEFRKDG